jgi:hypothetical protein
MQFDIARTVSVIQRSCFQDWQFLRQFAADSPYSLEHIEEEAFAGTGVTSLRIPASLSGVDESTFLGSRISLVDVRIGYPFLHAVLLQKRALCTE